MYQIDIVPSQLPFIFPTYTAGKAAIRHEIQLFYNQQGVVDSERPKFSSLKKRLYIQLIEKSLLKKAY